MHRLKKIEYWIENGALFEKINGIWTAFAEESCEDLGSGETFEEMIDNMPNPKCLKSVEFKDVPIGSNFMYLDQEWKKVNPIKCARIQDNFSYYLNEESFVDLI
jgi:hypothetical protein